MPEPTPLEAKENSLIEWINQYWRLLQYYFLWDKTLTTENQQKSWLQAHLFSNARDDLLDASLCNQLPSDTPGKRETAEKTRLLTTATDKLVAAALIQQAQDTSLSNTLQSKLEQYNPARDTATLARTQNNKLFDSAISLATISLSTGFFIVLMGSLGIIMSATALIATGSMLATIFAASIVLFAVASYQHHKKIKPAEKAAAHLAADLKKEETLRVIQQEAVQALTPRTTTAAASSTPDTTAFFDKKADGDGLLRCARNDGPEGERNDNSPEGKRSSSPTARNDGPERERLSAPLPSSSTTPNLK